MSHAGRRLAEARGPGRPRRWRAARSGARGDLAVVLVELAGARPGTAAAARARSAAAAGVSARVAELRGEVERRPVERTRPTASGCSRSRLRRAAPRCRRCWSMMWSRAICRSQRWNGRTGLRRYSGSRWLAWSNTSCTTSLASTRRPSAWSSRRPIIRRKGSRCRSQSRSAAAASCLLDALQERLGLGRVGPHGEDGKRTKDRKRMSLGRRHDPGCVIRPPPSSLQGTASNSAALRHPT